MSAIARWIHFPPSVWFQCFKSLAPWWARLTDFYHPLTRKFMSNLHFAGLKWPLCSWNGHSPTLEKFFNWPFCHLYWNGNSLLFLLMNPKKTLRGKPRVKNRASVFESRIALCLSALCLLATYRPLILSHIFPTYFLYMFTFSENWTINTLKCSC